MSAFIPVAICAAVVVGGLGWLKMLWWDYLATKNSGGAVTGGLQCEADPSPAVPPE